MKFLIDENIPFANEFFSGLGEVERFAGRELKPSQLVDVDFLLVRSITKVNESLLSQANKLKFVGTATIGEDHIDQKLLADRNIAFSSAPGCNAISVAEYVLSAIMVLAQKYNFDFQTRTLGIVGVGNIGKALLQKLQALGITTLLCDPVRAQNEQGNAEQLPFVSLDYLLANADIVTLHTPLTKTGAHPTWHLLNDVNLSLLKDDVCLINACRGAVIDNQALYQHIKQRALQNRLPIKLVLDVWENEPNPMPELVDKADIATAHIAGYSLEGKSRGTEILYKKVCQIFDITPSVSLSSILPTPALSKLVLDGDNISQNELIKLCHLVYDVRSDDALFRTLLNRNGFDWLRKNYPIRREWSALTLESGFGKEQIDKLSKLGFDIFQA